MIARPQDVVDDRGRAVPLGGEITSGGEGAIFEVTSDSTALAKIYSKPMTTERAEKIRLMTALSRNASHNLAAWPTALLLRRAQPIGLLMRRFPGKDIHKLYSPKSRRAEFARVDWRFLVHASANVARAFAAVHAAGCIIGDVNHGSVLVSPDATVRLVDCDSFQFTAGNRRFLCDVGIDTFTPPDLQGKPLARIVRTENHDNFGLAVMIFLMLFMGRHPFAGRFLGGGELSIPKAIEQCRFPYSLRRADVQMEPPPGVPPLAIVGDDVALLFELAFSQQMVADGRPSPREWFTALDKLEKGLRRCVANPAHTYHSGLVSCPWCPMEAATGVVLFTVAGSLTAGVLFDPATYRREVAAVSSPGPAPTVAETPATATPEACAVGHASKIATVTAAAVALVIAAFAVSGRAGSAAIFIIAAGVVVFFGLRKALDRADDRVAFRRTYEQAAERWRAAKQQWERLAGPGEAEAKLAQIADLERQWEALPAKRLRLLDDLKRNVRRRQLEQFLDRFTIDRAQIPGIGPGRKQTLEAFGIETAADVVQHQLLKVPGIGQVLSSGLLNWRRSVEARFVFDPNKGVDPGDSAKVEQDVLAERKQIEDRLQSALQELRQTIARIRASREQLRAQVEATWREHAQAQANWHAAGAG